MTGSTDANGPKILIADAHEDARLMVRECLEHHGFRVETAGDGAALLALAGWADLVLMGLRMPTVDEGIELLRAVRAMHDAPPVVVVSGDDTRRREAIAEGAAAFLVKTVAMEDLLKAIFVVLGTRRALHPTN